MPAATGRLNWQHGVGIGYYDPEGTMHSVYPLRIHSMAIFEGEIIRPEFSEERLSADTGYNLIWHARN